MLKKVRWLAVTLSAQDLCDLQAFLEEKLVILKEKKVIYTRFTSDCFFRSDLDRWLDFSYRCDVDRGRSKVVGGGKEIVIWRLIFLWLSRIVQFGRFDFDLRDEPLGNAFLYRFRGGCIIRSDSFSSQKNVWLLIDTDPSQQVLNPKGRLWRLYRRQQRFVWGEISSHFASPFFISDHDLPLKSIVILSSWSID